MGSFPKTKYLGPGGRFIAILLGPKHPPGWRWTILHVLCLLDKPYDFLNYLGIVRKASGSEVGSATAKQSRVSLDTLCRSKGGGQCAETTQPCK